jgi:hypothetical protein
MLILHSITMDNPEFSVLYFEGYYVYNCCGNAMVWILV